jgi:hypothetical protein
MFHNLHSAAFHEPKLNRRRNPSTAARRLATHMLGEFFAQPILSDRPTLRLVVDNDPSKTVP